MEPTSGTSEVTVICQRLLSTDLEGGAILRILSSVALHVVLM